MATQPLRLDEDLIKEATIEAKASFRTMPKQIEYWAKIGSAALANPDLPADFIADCLEGLEEIKAGKSEPFDYK